MSASRDGTTKKQRAPEVFLRDATAEDLGKIIFELDRMYESQYDMYLISYEPYADWDTRMVARIWGWGNGDREWGYSV